MEKQIVIFKLGKDDFGIDIASVEAIVKIIEITKIPKSPIFIEGVTNLRGSVIPVIDLHKRFEIGVHIPNEKTRMVIAITGNYKVGMIVSEVTEVLTIEDTTIEPPPPVMTSLDTAFISGIARIDDRLVIMLDLAKILSLDEINQLELPVE